MRETKTHIFFWGSEFSNWHHCEFTYKGHDFKNTEQAFMWEKAMYFNDQEIADEILITPSPSSNKGLGRAVKNFDPKTWLVDGYPIMVAVNLSKYFQNEDLKKILLRTGDKILVEASPYDTIWGIGLKESDNDVLDESKWKGKNLLGKALMDVRNHIKYEIYLKHISESVDNKLLSKEEFLKYLNKDEDIVKRDGEKFVVNFVKNWEEHFIK